MHAQHDIAETLDVVTVLTGNERGMHSANLPRCALHDDFDAYTRRMTRRTSINLDFDLVEEAKAILETRETTETIHRALAEVVRQARLQRLIQHRFDFHDSELDELRRSRTDEAAPVSMSTRRASS